MNKKTIISVMVVAMLVTVSLYFVGGTYARYTDKLTGTATANIAKWAVKVGGQDASTSKTLNLSFTTDKSEFVTDGKIAPGSSISAEVVLDLTGTEVAVDVLGKIETDSLADIIGTSEFTTKITVDGNDLQETAQSAPTIALGAISNEHKVKITITWDNQDDVQSVSDTALGRSEETTSLELPVTLTVQQHIAKTV